MVLILNFFLCPVSPSYGYDPLDPKGNITIKWDLLQSNSDTNDVKVSLLNFQLYRHIEQPGWKLGWEWLGKEVIWSIQGAEATEQGNCSRFKGGQLPHCFENKPLIVDLLPGAPYNIQTSNCCKGGVLSSMIQDPAKYAAVFQMNIRAGGAADSDFDMPQNFSLGVPGYTCAKPVQVASSKYSSDGGRRWTQALGTWNVTCIYSQYQASTSPKCCVSLSAFYNDSIVHCPKCSCSCQGLPGSKCVKFGETPSLLQQVKDPNQEPPSIVRCTQHMCPIRVHWHVKQSYKEYWRVKITVNNLNILKNYSGWNLVALHPNLKSLTQVFSFNYHPLNQYGHINDSGMFWGVEYYNDMLLQEGEVGNVQSEMLLHKDEGIFSFREGWVFPRRILFNGDECVMPPPDDYPRLPKNTARAASFTLSIIFSSLFMLLFIFAC
ncbi:hypothetical protein ES319_D12G028300v1 [Gossypium barbadense]|uniref:COBRA-like protein n=1 Tax=Gossypium barbadense TaxID=3634 RepID=A0A5J5NT58_GOSBA|nr:hypothetical protein ES319_D12G028300v1 [Gossypium barbadense]